MMYITVNISSAQFQHGEYFIYIRKSYNIAGWCSVSGIVFAGGVPYKHKSSAVRAAKKIAKKLGIKFKK